MADFVAVLKKTLDGLGETTPEIRARVYDKARTTISAKLAAITPPPAPAVIDRQKAALEQAIKTIEAEYSASSPPPPADDFDAVMKSDEYLDLVARGLLWSVGKLGDDGKPAQGYGPGGK